MTVLRVAVAVIVFLVAGLVVFVIFAWRPGIAAIEPPKPESFDSALIKRGGQLSALGNCSVCHTVEAGAVFAGGRPIETPFGTVYSTNITPDANTGIGRWSLAAFTRALREGVDRAGSHLYPAFPYDHFTLLRDEDIGALYAFLMTRKPIEARAPANELVFPLNMRMIVAGWKLLYLRQGPFENVAGRSPEWNHGAYLVEGIAHCGGCHSPRNALGAEDKDRAYAGSHAEGWYAYAINSATPAPVPWDVDSLHAYLKTGFHELHGVSRGPMAPVTTGLGAAPDEDLRAIATYVAGLMGEITPQEAEKAKSRVAQAKKTPMGGLPASADSLANPGAPPELALGSEGEAIYAAACANCHETARPLPYGGIHLSLSTGVNAPEPTNVINTVRAGLPQRSGEISPLMPAFGAAMTDEQVAALLAYLRERFSDEPAWNGLLEAVRDARAREIHSDVHAVGGLRSLAAD